MNGDFRAAERQYGVITRAQLEDGGLSEGQIEHRLTTVRLELLFPAVYRVVGSVSDAHQVAKGATLWLGEESLVSHLTAAAFLHLEGVRADALHVTIPSRCWRGRGESEVIVHRSLWLPKHHRRRVDGIPCTSAARTIVDCAALLDLEALETALESARRMGLATTTTVSRALASGGRRTGATAMRRVLAAAETRPLESRLEVKLARLLRSSALAPSVAQFPVGPYRLDRAWPAFRVAVEADGFQHHGSRLQWKRDRRRLAVIEAAGWRIVHVTWDDVTREPARTLDRIRGALGTMVA
jgi:very-short-patch-repair endonuclease